MKIPSSVKIGGKIYKVEITETDNGELDISVVGSIPTEE